MSPDPNVARRVLGYATCIGMTPPLASKDVNLDGKTSANHIYICLKLNNLNISQKLGAHPFLEIWHVKFPDEPSDLHLHIDEGQDILGESQHKL